MSWTRPVYTYPLQSSPISWIIPRLECHRSCHDLRLNGAASLAYTFELKAGPAVDQFHVAESPGGTP